VLHLSVTGNHLNTPLTQVFLSYKMCFTCSFEQLRRCKQSAYNRYFCPVSIALDFRLHSPQVFCSWQSIVGRRRLRLYNRPGSSGRIISVTITSAGILSVHCDKSPLIRISEVSGPIAWSTIFSGCSHDRGRSTFTHQLTHGLS